MQPSAPEVKLTYKAAGRETLAAIDQELGATSLSTTEAPMIEISETPAGRETMAAIAEELAESMGRPRQNTLPYADKIANAPGARLPSRAPKLPSKPAPKATSEAPAVSVAEPPTLKKNASPEALEIFELLTFIVRGNTGGELTSDAARRQFIEAHLRHRLPGNSLDSVERIEVTPWTTKGTMVIRIWCRA